jgi:hypothetical protein
MVDYSSPYDGRTERSIMMLALLKILTFPIWFPIKILWAISKFVAFVFVVFFIAALLYILLHVF